MENQNTESSQSSPVQGSGLDVNKFSQQAKKKGGGRPTKAEVAEREKKGWMTGVPKALTEEQKKLKAEQEEKYRELCYAPGMTKIVSALYRKGMFYALIVEFKIIKVPTTYIPDDPIPHEDADAWAFSLIDWMVNNLGPAETYGKLSLLCLFGMPILHLGEVAVKAKAKYQLDKIEGRIAELEKPAQ